MTTLQHLNHPTLQRANKPLRRFEVLAGVHVITDWSRMVSAGPQYRLPDGTVPRVPAERQVETGDVVETEEDLCQLNWPGFPPKFRALDLVPRMLNPTDIRPGESLAEFARRMAELAANSGGGVISQSQAIGQENLSPTYPQPDVTSEQQTATQQQVRAGRLETFQAMTVAELRKHASDEEVDLADARTKEEIIRRLMLAEEV